MKNKKGNRYTEEFKLNALKMITEKNKSIYKIARELNVNVMTLYRWRKE